MACRGHVIDLILATDMKLHFENISKFRLRRSSPDFDKTQGDDLWQTLRMCMKGGDISHALLPWEDHLAWSYRAVFEFYQQGDEDISAGRDVTPMFDRRKHAELPKGQAGFIRFVVLPLYDEIDAVCSTDEVACACLVQADENLRNWIAAGEEPQAFHITDQKQQESLRMDLALLATQKAINKSLSFRVTGQVQIVPPKHSNGGTEAQNFLSNQPTRGGELDREYRVTGMESKRESPPSKELRLLRREPVAPAMPRGTVSAAVLDRERRANMIDSKKESPRSRDSSVPRRETVVPALHQAPVSAAATAQAAAQHPIEAVVPLPIEGDSGIGLQPEDSVGEAASNAWPSEGTFMTLESRVHE